MKTKKGIKFFYNGMKVDVGKLIKGGWSYQAEHIDFGGRVYPECVRFYLRSYRGLPSEARVFFDDIQNDTDSQSDYFETDRVVIMPEHPLFEAAKAAVQADKDHWDAVLARREAKRAARRVA